MSTAIDDAVILYTVDGSNPIENGMKYTDALTISENTTLKAVVCQQGVLYGDILKLTYKITPVKIADTNIQAPVFPWWLYTQWGNNNAETYTVTFDLNYDGAVNAPATQYVKAGECAVEPVDPIRDGYIFEGWYGESGNLQLFDFLSPIYTSIILHAKWSKNMLTDSDLNDINIVDSTLQNNIFATTDYINMDIIKRISLAKAVLDDLVDQGLIINGSVIYDEDNISYSFVYKSNVMGVVSLKDWNNQENGIENGSRNTNNSYENITSNMIENAQLDPNCDAIILWSFNQAWDGIRYRTTYYAETHNDWESKGLNTILDLDVTVDDYKNLSKYEVIVISAHGAYNKYTYNTGFLKWESRTVPSILLVEDSTEVKDKSYEQDLLNFRVGKITVQGGTKYAILPEFINNYYGNNDSLSNSIVFSESCEFVGKGEFLASDTRNNEMINAFIGASVKSVTGFFNSVMADYSRELMKAYIDALIDGEKISQAYTIAINKCGANDSAYRNTGLIATPIFRANNSDDILSLQTNCLITGNVISETGESPLDDVTVKVLNVNGNVVFTGITDDNGKLTTSFIMNNYYTDFMLEISKEGYYSININDIKFIDRKYDFRTISLRSKPIVPKNCIITGSVTIADTDTDMTNNLPLEGATIKCYANSVHELLSAITTAYSDSNGKINHTFENVNGVNLFTIRIEKNGYWPHDRVNVTFVDGKYDFGTIELIPIGKSCSVSGLITIADTDTDMTNNLPLEGATITLSQGTQTISIVSSGVNGEYLLSNVPTGVYTITVSKEGYISVIETLEITGDDVDIHHNIAIEAISTDYLGIGYASGVIYDVATGSPVAGLQLNIRSGLNVTTGAAITQTNYTNANGKYTTLGTEAGNYTVEVVDNRTGISDEERYTTTSFNIKVLGGTTIDNQNGYVSNGLTSDELRIVLTWGSKPSDLDSHLVGPDGSGGKFHEYYSKKNDGSDADLDRDDTDSYGPETITIHKEYAGTYVYAIHNYSNKSSSNSTALANSGAQVQVYRGSNLLMTYYVPSNKEGTLWTVFSYDSTTKRLTTIGDMSYESSVGNVLQSATYSLTAPLLESNFEAEANYDEYVMIIWDDIINSVKGIN